MKMRILRVGFCLAIAGLLATEAFLQRTPRRRTTQPTTTQPTTTDPNQQQNNNNTQQPSGYDPYANVPIRVDTSGLIDNNAKKSLRPDNAFDKSSLSARTPLPYEHLRWD